MNIWTKYLRIILPALVLAFGLLAHALNAWAATAMPFIVTASEIVNVDTTGGTPRLALDIGGVTRYATYVSGTGTTALTFAYTAQAGDLDLNGIAVTSPLDLNGGTIRDASGNALSPATFTLPATTGVKVDYPSLSANMLTNRYTLNAATYNSLAAFLTAAGGTFSRASTATYFDSSGTLQTAASNVARFDTDPVTLASRGLLIEEARTNSFANSQMTGANIGMIANSSGPGGATGSIPSNWSTRGTLVSGLSAYITALGTENGMAYMDFRISGTASSASDFGLYQQNGNSIAASAGQVWTYSIYSKLISATGAYSSTSFGIVERNSAQNGIAVNTGNYTLTSTPARYIRTTNVTSASTAYIHGGFSIYYGAGAVNATIRVYSPQLEMGSGATSYIPTTSGAVTRALDILNIPIGSWYNTAAGTLYGKGATNIPDSSVGGATFADFNNGGAGQRFQVRTGSSGAGGYAGIMAGSGLQVRLGAGLVQGLNNAVTRVALAGRISDFALSVNGGALQKSNATGSMPAPTRLKFGAYAADTEVLNGVLQQVVYYPTRIDDTNLQLLTQ